MNDKIKEERNDAFDSAMREKLSGYEPAVPHALWTRISAELNETEIGTTSAVPMYTKSTPAPSKWRIAIAAAVIITLGAGSLLFTYSGNNEGGATVATAPALPAAPAISVPVATDSKTVADITSVAVAKSAAPVVNTEKRPANTTVAVNTSPETNDEPAPVVTTGQELANAPAATHDNMIDVSANMPLSSLKKLSSPVSLNDEITIIKSVPSKKKHHRHGEEETTRIIVIDKKYASQPDIRYQVPVRF